MKDSIKSYLKILEFAFYNIIVIICIKQRGVNTQTKSVIRVFVSRHAAGSAERIM
jgi:hypothetical protein